ncbi:MAG TPA: aldehyde dehydrogenase family protein, partial [Methylomirabilota bacterium]|nr:aldehyde dehydrogenase family protein [Methylomirabilota bacterium]
MAATTALSAALLPSFNPATGEVVAQIEATAPAALPALFTLARAAQRDWAARSVAERCALLRAFGEKLFAARDELAGLVVRETGKPRVEALFADLFVSLDSAKYYAANAASLLRPERVPHHSLAAKAKSGRLHFEPYGVIAVISSWNYPLALPLGQILPAVAAGNAVICKVSEFTPACGAALGQLFREAGFPDGLVSFVQGGGDVGAALIAAGPDKVIFTGSVATGRRVAEDCARRLIPSVLELGGKDAMVVLADADLEVAASGAVWGSFTNCGQVCLSVERIFVEHPAAAKFAQLCAEKTRALRLGPGSDPDSDVGPLIRPGSVVRMHELVEDAVERGARLLAGGRPRPDLGPCFYEPTVLADVDSTMRVFQEETFGPILAIQVARDADDAVARVNESPFALAASVWTGSTAKGRELARRLRAGTVMVNDAISAFAIAEAPHGGCASSGWGRTHSRYGLLEMVRLKYIDVDGMPHRAKP